MQLFLPWKPLEQMEGNVHNFQTAAGKKEKVSSATCFSKIVKEVIIFSLSFPHRTNMLELIDCDDDDVEKDTGIDFEIDSGPPKNWSCSVDLKTVILVTATDYEWNDDCSEIKKITL